MGMTRVFQQESEAIRVLLYSDGSGTIDDKANGHTWKMAPVAVQEYGPITQDLPWPRNPRTIFEQYPGRFAVEVKNDTLCYRLYSREGEARGSFGCDLQLDGAWFTFRIHSIDPALPSLVFPPPIESETLVVPSGPGRLIRSPLRRFRRYFHPIYSVDFNMRWFGGLAGGASWVAILCDGFEDSGLMLNELSASAGWLQSLGTWTPRTIHYRFQPGGYVELAKIFRSWAIDHDLHKPLVDKVRETPQLERLIGGALFNPLQAERPVHKKQIEDLQLPRASLPRGNLEAARVHFTHRQVKRMLEELPALGLKRGLFTLRGWLTDGYDGRHPEPWPPDPALGSIDEFRTVFSDQDDFVVGIHDNYEDMYEHCPSFPRGINRRRDGSLMAAGYWDYSQSYMLNSRDSLDYLKQNWEHYAGVGLGGLYIDTITGTKLVQSWEEGNTLSRPEDLAFKIEMLKFLKGNRLIVGSECGSDFGSSWVDWNGGRIHSWNEAGETVPLLYLVYHDSVLFTAGSMDGTTRGNPAWYLNHISRGLMNNYWIRSDADWDAFKTRVRSASFIDAWHARVGTDAMTGHRFLSEDGQVEETTFSSGCAAIVNRADEIREVEGNLIPPRWFAIRD